MSKLKSTQYARGKNKTRIAVPYDVEVFKRTNEFEEDVVQPNIDLSVVGNYVNRRENTELESSRDLEKIGNEEQTFVMENHDSEFFRNIGDIWKQGEMCDVMLSVQNKEFRVHKIVLSGCSEHFRELFANREKSAVATVTELPRIPLLGIKSDIVNIIIDAVYSSKITLDSTSVGDVLSAAAYLRMPSIINSCQMYLSRRVNVDNCLRTLQIAHLYELEILKERSCEIACPNFKPVSLQRDFEKLRYYELLSILPRQDLVVDSEIEVFNAIIRWADVKRSTRLPYVGRLMRHVRFPLMTESHLVDHVERSKIVGEIPEVSELVREGVRYHLLPYRRSILQNPRTVPRTTYEMKAIIASGGLPGKEDGSSTGRIYYYDPKVNRWDPLTKMPEPRHHHAAVVLGGFLYIAGGDQKQGSMDSSDKVWRYNPWTEEWIEVEGMIKARQCFQLGVLVSRIYAVGGRSDKDATLSDVERYNPSTNTWTAVEHISSPRRYVALATLSGRLYAVGGSGSDLISRRVERYNPVSSQWERRHPLCKPRFSAFLHAAKNRLWLIGGATVHEKDPTKGAVETSEIEVYSPAMDQWTVISGSNSRMKGIPEITNEGERKCTADQIIRTCRTEAGSCILDENVYLVAGYSWSHKDRLNDVEKINLSNLSPHFPKCSTINVFQSPNRTAIPENAEEKNCTAAKPSHYPLRCTGVACAVLTLHKKPNFTTKQSGAATTRLQIHYPNKRSADTNRPEQRQSINTSRFAFGEAPKTAAGRFCNGTEEHNSNAREHWLEKGLDFLRSMEFPANKFRNMSSSPRPCTANERPVSPRLRGNGFRTCSASNKEVKFDLKEKTPTDGAAKSPVAKDEVDVAITKVVSLALDNWDDQSGRESTPATEIIGSSVCRHRNHQMVFMTE